MIRILALITAILVGFAAKAEDLYARYEMRVTRVIDADTFVGDLILPDSTVQFDQQIRIACVQAAERNTAEGQGLKALVEDWLLGETVFLSHFGSRTFTRRMARVHVPGHTETLSQRLYREYDVPLYRGSSTSRRAVQACLERMER